MARASANAAKPPRGAGPIAWMRENLFSSPFNTALTLGAVALLWVTVPPFINWAIIDAVWRGETRDVCMAPETGACWAYIAARLDQIIYGFYDTAERWRADAVFIIGAIGIFWLATPRLPHKRFIGVFMLIAYPALSYVLLSGGLFGLDVVPSAKWGGLLLTLIVAVTGIVASLPLGILLALGRRSQLPVVRILCIAFIEFVRGVPLITILFMASNLLPLFLPEGLVFDKLLRALVAVALFSAAYMAEVVRGGLQSVPQGQYEAAKSLGLGYWRMMIFIILPQALKTVMPSIVNTFIGLFKDTSLVSIIGFSDLLGIIQKGNADPEWSTPVTAATGYLFAAAIFWAFCFSMSRYSAWLERNVAGGKSGAGKT